MKNLIFVNGTMGVGKTATCIALMDLLKPAAYLDGDWCWTMKPWRVSDQNVAMVEKNISVLLSGYLANTEIENVIFGWVMHRQAIVTKLVDMLRGHEFELFVFTLTCSAEALTARISADVARGLRTSDVLQNSLERQSWYQDMPWPKIDVSHIDAKQAANRIAADVRAENTIK
jgi:broad-specificity NMP kinase